MWPLWRRTTLFAVVIANDAGDTLIMSFVKNEKLYVVGRRWAANLVALSLRTVSNKGGALNRVRTRE